MTHTLLGYKLEANALNTKTYNGSCGLVLAKDANAASNIHKEANRARTVQIKARGEAAHSFMAYHVIIDASSNRDKFLSTRLLEAGSSLDSRQFTNK